MTIVALPPMVYEGRQVYRSIAPAVVTGTFAVTTACPCAGHPPLGGCPLRAGRGHPGAIGKEGQDYVANGRGRQLAQPAGNPGHGLPGQRHHLHRHGHPGRLQRCLPAPIPAIPWWGSCPDRWIRCARWPLFPPFSLTEAEEQRIAPCRQSSGGMWMRASPDFAGERALTQEE